MRFFVSFLLGCAVVFGMLLGGLALFGVFDKEDAPSLRTYSVDSLTPEERDALAKMFGEEINQPNRPLAAPGLSTDITGFVQLEVDVAVDGTVAGARVIGATPPGVFEDQALREILLRQFPPDESGTGAEALRTVTETIEFSVPAEPNSD